MLKIFLAAKGVLSLRRNRVLTAAALSAFLLMCGAVRSQELIFGQPYTYGIGPRAMGMGDAFTAVADDASAAYWNVAGLAQLSSYELSVSSAPVYFMDTLNGKPAFGFPWYASLQFMMPIAKENTLGISLFRPFHYQQDFYAGSLSPSANDRAEQSYLLNPSFQQSEIMLSYAARFSAVRNFSVGINVKRITNDPYYIRYFGNATDNPLVAAALQNPVRVIGYGIDLGLLYKIPITKYSEEFRIGLALNDIVARAQYSNGLVFTDTAASNNPVVVNVGPGFETQIPPQITLGLAYKNDFLFKIRNMTALDFEQISDPRFNSASNKYLRFGTEFWFLRDVLGIRAGYSTPLSTPGTIHLGGSIRALNGDFQMDVAFLQPVSPSADIASGSQIGNFDIGGINYEQFYIGASMRFGGGQELPPPKVDAFVRPGSFTPSQGEKATFFLDTTEDVTLNHWSVLIYDQSDHLVRSLRGEGSPPTKIVWGGENDRYEPLPPGVYTWSFQVEDNLDHVGSTPVRTVEILGPSAPEAARNPSQLLSLRQQQAALLAQERQQLTALAEQNLKQLLGTEEAAPNTATAAGTPPVEAAGNTMFPEAGTVPVLGFNNVSPDQVLNAHFDKNADGEPVVVVSYRSNLTYVPYLYQEAAEVIKSSVNSVGTGLKEIETHVYYGKNELNITTSTPTAANYATGKISQLQMLQLSDIHINGEKVGPNGY